jgi:hypothetical protein
LTVIWQTHRWRGFSAEANLFQEWVLVAGFFTLYVTRKQLLDKILEMLKAAKDLRG